MKYIIAVLLGLLIPFIVIADDSVKYDDIEVIKIISDFPEVELLVREEFKNEPVMIRIALAESRFDPKAKNPDSTAKGIYQILDGTWKDYGCEGEVLNVEDNIRCARIIFERDSTDPWLASEENWK
jgi:hypothetical protein